VDEEKPKTHSLDEEKFLVGMKKSLEPPWMKESLSKSWKVRTLPLNEEELGNHFRMKKSLELIPE
jgi:hypothetical protein